MGTQFQKGEKNTATCAIGAQRRQYTTEQVVKIAIAAMFSTFVQSASCGIDVKVHA